jgi:hypothetical protein
VIGLFPNEEPLIRTIEAVLIEESHQKQSGRALFSHKTFKEFITPEVIKPLIETAHGQQRVMAAQTSITRCPPNGLYTLIRTFFISEMLSDFLIGCLVIERIRHAWHHCQAFLPEGFRQIRYGLSPRDANKNFPVRVEISL